MGVKEVCVWELDRRWKSGLSQDAMAALAALSYALGQLPRALTRGGASLTDD